MQDRIDRVMRILHNLNLESSRSSASTGLLELASLGSDVRLDTIVCVGVVDRGLVAEMAHRSTVLLPLGERRANGSKVMHSPPALTMRALLQHNSRRTKIREVHIYRQ